MLQTEPYKIIKVLETLTSDTDRISVIEDHSDNKDFVTVLRLALSETVKFGFNSIPEYKKERYSAISFNSALIILETKISGRRRNKKLINELIKVLSSVSAVEADILERIVLKNLKVNVGKKIVNLALGYTLISDFGITTIVKADKNLLDKIEYPAYVQTYTDRSRVYIIIDSRGNAQFLSSNGKNVETLGVFEESLKPYTNCVIDAYMVFLEDNGEMSSKRDNINAFTKCVRSTITEDDMNKFILIAHDAIPIDNVKDQKPTVGVPYNDRFAWLRQIASKSKTQKLFIVNTKTVNSGAETRQALIGALDSNKNGIVVRNINAEWTPDKSYNDFILTADNTANLIIRDVVRGTGEEMGNLVGFVCTSECGLLEVFVPENATENLPNNEFINQTVNIKYDKVINGVDKKTLFMPILNEISNNLIPDVLENL